MPRARRARTRHDDDPAGEGADLAAARSMGAEALRPTGGRVAGSTGRRGLAGRRWPLLVALAAVVLWWVPAPAAFARTVGQPRGQTTYSAPSGLSMADAVIFGLVEGITEYLPISSTGHLTVTAELLGLTDTEADEGAIDTYTIAIQAGAILAVLLVYWRRVVDVLQGLVGRSEEGRRVLVALVLAFLPAGLVAFALQGPIETTLLAPWPVVAAWAVGGVVILWASRTWAADREGQALAVITTRQALIIGATQALALWPGVSRSLVVILAGLAVGLSMAAAVEFAFLLGLVTLGIATAYSALTDGSEMVDTFGLAAPLVGLAVAFLSALVAVRWMVGYLQERGLAIFGWYRLGVAGVVAVLLTTGTI